MAHTPTPLKHDKEMRRVLVALSTDPEDGCTEWGALCEPGQHYLEDDVAAMVDAYKSHESLTEQRGALLAELKVDAGFFRGFINHGPDTNGRLAKRLERINKAIALYEGEK